MTTPRFDLPVPLTQSDLQVLAWYAAWTPKVHEANWKRARAWPPGFRAMADCSVHDTKRIDSAKRRLTYPPALKGEDGIKRSGARSRLDTLLAYRLLEGVQYSACRLTARGRAALKAHGYDCPDYFESHCEDIFDVHTLLPMKGTNTHIDFMDNIMSRLGDEYRVKYGEPLPDNETTWGLMLAEYAEDDYNGNHTLTGCKAGLRACSSTGKHLNGSLRRHSSYVHLDVDDPHGHKVLEIALSYEQLSALLVSNADVAVTIDFCYGPDGMARSYPAPPPVSVARRMKERIRRGNQDLQNRVRETISQLEDARMAKGLKQDLIDTLGLVLRDADAHGNFAAQQAMEEMSGLAESLMTIVTESAAMSGSPLITGPVSPTLLLEGEVTSVGPEDGGDPPR